MGLQSTIEQIDRLIDELESLKKRLNAKAWQQRDFSLRQMAVFVLREHGSPVSPAELRELIRAKFDVDPGTSTFGVLVRDESRKLERDARRGRERRDYVVNDGEKYGLSTWS